MLIIEMNPRVSRSSALASKATGFRSPRWRRSSRWATRSTRSPTTSPAASWTIHAGLVRAEHRLRGHQGAALRVREVPAGQRPADHPDEVGGRGDGDRRTFQESFQKALRGLEIGVDGLNQRTRDRETLERELGEPGPERIWYVGDAFENGFTLGRSIA